MVVVVVILSARRELGGFGRSNEAACELVLLVFGREIRKSKK